MPPSPPPARRRRFTKRRSKPPNNIDKATPAKSGKTKKKKKKKPTGTKKTNPAAKSVKAPRQPKKYGPHRRAKLAERGTRIQRRHHISLAAMLAELPRNCSLGVKTSSKGHQHYWRGYKLHWDVASGRRIPIGCVLTGAGVHDSQVAIPLMEISGTRVKWRCDVMDSAYVAAAIRKKAKKLKHEVPIQPVERPHYKKPPVWTEAQKQRFKIRTIVEPELCTGLKGGGSREALSHLEPLRILR